jgi:hypothetical protein
MRLVRRFLKIAAILVLVLVVALAAVWFYLDSIARKAVEVAGTYALGVPTTLEKANLGVFSGHAGITGLRVADPQGYDAPYFMQLQGASVDLSLGSLTKDTVEVPLLELDGLAIALEKRNGKANYQVILDNLKKLESAAPAQQPAKPGKKFIIRKVELKNITAHVDLVPALGSATVLDMQLDPIVLENVGSESNHGVAAEQLMDTLTKAVLLAVAHKAGNAVGELGSDLGKGLGQLSSLASSGVGVVGDVGGKLGNFGVGAAQQVGQGVSEGVNRIGKGIGSLFGGGDNSGNSTPTK